MNKTFNTGQFRRNNLQNYMNDIDFVGDIKTSGSAVDSCLVVKEGLTPNKTYFLSFRVKNLKDNNSINIKLSDMNTPANKSINIKKFNMNNVKDGYSYYSMIFTPLKESTQVVFTSDSEDELAVHITSFKEIVNVIDKLKDTYSLKNIVGLTLQGKPGMQFTLNGGEFSIGQSGKYILQRPIKINRLGFAIEEDSNEFFIMDFKYE